MGRRLAGGLLSIVAAVATAGRFGVIHPLQRQPAGCPVAGVTLVGGRRVIRGLAFPPHPVMADYAGRGGEEMIEPGSAETPEVVALAAIQVGRNVPGVLAAGKDAIVALPAARWRTPEDLVAVAVAAVDAAVRALKGEGGGVVIEIGGPHTPQGYPEGPGIVAGAAFLPGGDVLGRARRQISIVAAAAPGGGIFEVVIRMTVCALQGGVYAQGGQRGGLVIVAFGHPVIRGGNRQAARQKAHAGQYQARHKTGH